MPIVLFTWQQEFVIKAPTLFFSHVSTKAIKQVWSRQVERHPVRRGEHSTVRETGHTIRQVCDSLLTVLERDAQENDSAINKEFL